MPTSSTDPSRSRSVLNDNQILAKKLMDEFALRTGLLGAKKNITRRYLWTDAFAVFTFFDLARILGDKSYSQLALQLIDSVHFVLGRYHPTDEREGWLSGFNNDQAQRNPVAAGLRIGKRLPERDADEAEDPEEEWDRDGQYLHYLTRWCLALLKAFEVTKEARYVHWAAKLSKVSINAFLNKNGATPSLYWKMSTDLSRPLVASMGAHDPLDGYVTLQKVCSVDKEANLAKELELLTQICGGQNWSTDDALGLGGLLLTALRVSELPNQTEFPAEVRLKTLLGDALGGLIVFSKFEDVDGNDQQRLAFRELGLSIGLKKALSISTAHLSAGEKGLLTDLKHFSAMGEEIKNFWSKESHRTGVWEDHQDLNDVLLASRLLS